MPTYVYSIEALGGVIEVQHTTALTPKNWGELCLLAKLDPLDIPESAEISKLISTTGIPKNAFKKPLPAACNTDSDCPSCGLCGEPIHIN